MIELYTLGRIDLYGPDGRAVNPVLARPKRLALLCYLALTHPRDYCRRDTLLPLFWPELDQTHARVALRKAVHSLRQSLGAHVLLSRGDDEIGLAPGALRCDAAEFLDAAAHPTPATLRLYAGDLLPGLYVTGAPDFERWLAAERQRLRGQAAEAAWALAGRERDGSAAVAWARRALALAPDDEVGLRRLLCLLDRLGDRAGAARAFEDFSRYLATELELQPSAETLALVDAIRRRTDPAPVGSLGDGRGALAGGGHPHVAVPPTWSGAAARPGADAADAEIGERHADVEAEAAAGESPAADLARSVADAGSVSAVERMGGMESVAGADHAAASRRPHPARGRRRSILAGGAILGFASLALMAARLVSPLDSEPPLLAVGIIHDFTGTVSAPALTQLLTTEVSRVRGLRVVSPERIEAMLHGARGTAALARAARSAGAHDVLEGAVYRLITGQLRLDLRRVDLDEGAVRGSFTVEGEDLPSLASAAAAELAASQLVALRVAGKDPPGRPTAAGAASDH